MKLGAVFSTFLLSLTNFSLAQLSAAPIVEKIAPNSTSCPSDNNECRTAAQAAPWIALGMWQYHIFSVKEMAAIVSLIAFESGDFKYKTNHFPGRPGQGTANMQQAKFNLAYAKQIPGVMEKVAQYDSVDNLSNSTKNAILDLVTPDEYNFASGAWFMSTYCSQEIRDQINEEPDKGYEAYITECVGTTITPERLAYWDRAKDAFGFA